MKVQHSIVNNNKLNTVPVVNGQVVYVKDTHDLYFDVNNTRTKATDIIFVGTLQERDAIQSPTPNKVYCVEEDNKFYRYENNAWVQLGYEEQIPQVFYWDGNQQQAGLDFWTNIYETQKTTPCIVVHTEKVFGAGARYKTFVWHYYNNLPTGGGETTYSNIGSWDFNQYGTSSGFNVYTIVRASLYFTITNEVVTTIHYSTEVQDINYLDTQKNVAGNYVPQYNNSPANKKYVDDSLAAYTPPAADVEFDNTGTGIEATTVEDAIVELNTKIGDLNTLINEINGE